MKRFDRKVFLFAFSTALSIGGIVVGVVVVGSSGFTAIRIFLIVVVTILAAIIVATVAASYRILNRVAQWTYRGLMRKLAKRAIRSSFSTWLTRVECLGIINREGTVALKVTSLASVVLTNRFNVYDNVNKELWGRVEVVQVDETTCLCVPYDRVNPEFWEHLEDRMRYDTSPPSVYLVRQLPEAELLEWVESILNIWK